MKLVPDKHYKKSNFLILKEKQDFMLKKLHKVICGVCGQSEIEKPPSKFIGQCDVCKSFHDFLTLLPHQQFIYNLDNEIICNIGAVGSGKTTVDAAKFRDHVLATPNGRYIIYAQTEAQLIGTAMVEFENHIHREWLINRTKKEFLFKNGARVE